MSKLKKTLIALIIFIAICLVLALKYNDMVSFDNPKYYRQAVNFYEKKDYQNAYYNFSKIKKISPLYAPALFKQAMCAEKLKDNDTAIKKYKLLIEKFPKSIFSPRARYGLAKAYFNENQIDKAESMFLQIKRQGFVEDYIIASSYYLGLIYKDSKPEEAKKSFIEYLTLSPSGTYSLKSAQELSEAADTLTQKENLLIGTVFYNNKMYNKALEFFQKAEENKCWYYLADIYKSKYQYKNAMQVLEKGIKFYSKTIDSKLLYKGMDLFVTLYDRQPKNGWFYLSKIVQENKSNGEDYILFKLAKCLKDQESLNLYSRVFYKYPKSNFAPEALWRLFWHEYQKQDYKKAKKLASEFIKRYPESPLYPRMLYWMSKTCTAQNRTSEANGYLNRILTKYPDDYYAFRAEATIRGMKNAWVTKAYHKLDERDLIIDFPISYSIIDIKDLKLINTLFELGDSEIWSELNYNNKIVESWIEYKRGNTTLSAILARDGISELNIKPPFSDDAYKLAYPIHWASIINENASKYELDPYLMVALIREESYFNPKARSITNAVGLMQLMPSTASYIAGKYGLKRPGITILENPEKNIKYGCAYFNYVKNTLNDNDLMAIAAYNGGPNAVKLWKERIKYDDFDEFVENIPYPETKEYVKKVYRSYWNYMNIYNF